MIQQVVSGGQTGVDRAALDTALKLAISHGGWCPKGRKAEDGPIANVYNLEETPTADYAQRTEWNVRDSGGTLIITQGAVGGGTALTIEWAKRYERPLLIVDLNKKAATVLEQVQNWIQENNIEVLNVAGPRASEAEGIYSKAAKLLCRVLKKGAS